MTCGTGKGRNRGQIAPGDKIKEVYNLFHLITTFSKSNLNMIQKCMGTES